MSAVGWGRGVQNPQKIFSAQGGRICKGISLTGSGRQKRICCILTDRTGGHWLSFSSVKGFPLQIVLRHSLNSSSDSPVPDSLAGRGGTRFNGSYWNDRQWEPADMTPFFEQTTWPGSSSRPRAQ